MISRRSVLAGMAAVGVAPVLPAMAEPVVPVAHTTKQIAHALMYRNARIVALAAAHERRYRDAYGDTTGLLTIGYGCK